MSGLQTLEHVAVTVSITHPRRGSLELQLFCPSGMMSLIGAPRSMDSYVPPPLSPLQPGPLPGQETWPRARSWAHGALGGWQPVRMGFTRVLTVLTQHFTPCPSSPHEGHVGSPVPPRFTNEETRWSS